MDRTLLACRLAAIILASASPSLVRAAPTPGFALDNGDVNGDLAIDLSDPIQLLAHLYLGAASPVPLAWCDAGGAAVANGDSNGDGGLDVSDPVHLLGWLFTGGSAPRAACGEGAGGARNPNPRIIPPHASAFGKTYGEWSAAWITWALSIPAAENPLTDDDGSRCGVGQAGKVWFLGGRICAADNTSPLACTFPVTERTCCVPAGTAILCPVANAWCDSVGVDPPPTVEELEACATFYMDSFGSSALAVDGVPLLEVDAAASSPYRVVSPPFTYHLPEDSVYELFGYELPAQDAQAVGDGIYVMLAPLSSGEHEIRIGDDTIYHLTVGGCGEP
jgi:hypothetical protein